MGRGLELVASGALRIKSREDIFLYERCGSEAFKVMAECKEDFNSSLMADTPMLYQCKLLSLTQNRNLLILVPSKSGAY